MTLLVKNENDLKLELIKSETCTVYVPEIDLELTRGTLGTQLTTVEGLLRLVLDDLQKHVTTIHAETPPEGVESTGEQGQVGSLAAFLLKLERLADGDEGFTLIMDDPLSNSFIQQEDFADLVNEEYERSETLNTELGLNVEAL